ncbi:hypothetical protein CALK_0906 [Chitinivibrio alkaliphilus ACht1]|uniref:Uncharacterized protein n=1 Tax=Chitinivibrio alkaliphilus ACht1 TaxID=1313304 RepID=U7D9B6_9BACT|nr:hypothetical protein CALK_0906 [Chitinivibrio alkaliphilus ACht1]
MEAGIRLSPSLQNHTQLSYTRAYLDMQEKPPSPFGRNYHGGHNHRIHLTSHIALGKRTRVQGFWLSNYAEKTDWVHTMSFQARVTF